MEFTHHSPMRQWLYERRHPIWFGYIEPAISIIAVGLMLAGLFVLEAIAILSVLMYAYLALII